MMRSFLISLSKARWAQRLITSWSLAWQLASRFVAGERTEDAIRVLRELNARGINGTLDQLGENTRNRDEACQATEDLLHLLDEIQWAGVRSGISIKLTQIGLALDEELCRENLQRILERAAGYHNFVRIDIEDSPYVDRTFAMYLEMRKRGFDNVGIALQSYLYRSEADLRNMAAVHPRVRLVKGAYKEPSEIAFPRKSDVDRNFDTLTDILLDMALEAGAPRISADGRTPPIPAIATHDEMRIQHAREYANTIGLPKEALEFQMLYGIRRELQDQLAAEGYPVRVYIPYGTHWYPYLMRRLAERPANLWFFLSNFFRR